MTMVNMAGQMYYPDWAQFDPSSTMGTVALDANTDRQCYIFRIPASGNIDNIHFRLTASTLAGSSVITVNVQTVSTATGLPTGTNYKSHTSATLTDPTSGNKSAAVNITSAVAGDEVALVIALTTLGSGSATIQTRCAIPTSPSQGTNYPYRISNSAASDVLTEMLGCAQFGLEYASSTYYPVSPQAGACVFTNSTATVNNAGTYRRGNIFRPPFKCRAVGMWVQIDVDGNGFLRLYNTSDTLLATATLYTAMRPTNGARMMFARFDSGTTVTLSAGTDYYAVWEGNSVTNSTVYLIQNIPANAMLDQLSGGKQCYAATYNGAWDTTATTTRYCIGVIIDQVDDGAGGAGGMIVHPGMAGGMRG